ncbi:hypothetical protein [Clostridium sp.]|uniref:hypothetical protein n=1 Tax=Clostridium sp. TaxID=1506 RepID=UPI003F39E354
MNSALDYINIDISIDDNNLCVNQKTNIKLDIKNISEHTIENSLFELILNDSVFTVLDNNCNAFVNNFVNLGDIDPGFEVSINIPIIVTKVPDKLFESICCYLSFNVIDNSNLLDFTYKSDDFNIDFLSKISEDDFRITTSRHKYFIDEDIDFAISLENNSIYDIKNIQISDYIPLNAILCKNSIVSPNCNIHVSNDVISIDKVGAKESICINFKVNVKGDTAIKSISLKPSLSYMDINSKEIIITSSSINIEIDSDNIINKDNFVYKIDKNEGFIDDILTHSISISNPSKTDLFDLVLLSNNIGCLEFIENSLVINDIYQIGETIYHPVKLGDLDSGDDLVITFQTKVISLDVLENIFFNLDYETKTRNISQSSNNQNFTVLSPIFDTTNFKKFQSADSCNIGDVLDITIEAINTGNYTATNVIIKDNLTSGLEFVNYSLYINNVAENFNNIEDGIFIGDVDPQEKVILSYKARAIDILPKENSHSTVSYNYNERPTLKTFSNEVSTTVVGARIGNNDFDMCMSNYTAQIGDIVSCMLSIQNTGSVDCENLKIYHPLNDALEFVHKSLVVNGYVYDDVNIFNTLNLERILSGESLNISYKFKVIDFPRPNPLNDRVSLEYSYKSDTGFNTETVYSNKNKLYINNPLLNIIDINSNPSSKDSTILEKICYKGDYIFFNIEMQNKGNVGLEDICLKLNLPEDLVLDKDSIKINNGPCKNLIDNNVILPNINVSQRIHIEFFAKHNFIKDYNLETCFNIDYTFRDLKSKMPFKKTQSFKENIIILNPSIEINKFIIDKSIDANREFTKNINITNTGNINLFDVNLYLNENDFLKKCNKVIFMNGSYIENSDSITIDNLAIGKTINLAIRYTLDSLLDYQNIIPKSLVVAKYTIDNKNNFTSIKEESNSLQLNIRNFNISINDKCSSETVMLNSINKYMLNITNLGNVDCSNIKLNIDLAEDVSYVENSLCINDRNAFIKNLVPKLDIGTLKINESKNISLDFMISNLPYQNKLKLQAIAVCEYHFDEESTTKEFSSDSLELEVENVSVDIVKISSTDTLQADDILQVQTIINNVGTTNIKSLHLQDNFNKSLSFIDGSVFIDGENIEDINPLNGICIPYLEAGSNLLLTYDYKYSPTISSNKIAHFSDFSYIYVLKDNSEHIVNTKSDTLYLEGALSTFKEFSMENEYHLKDFEPSIGEVINTFTTATIDEYYEISSIKNTAIDNISSTGKKVILKGFVVDRIEYLTEGEYSSLYMLERNQPFSIFINLPHDYDCEEIHFTAKCNNIFYKTLGNRDIFVSSLISIEGSL